MKTTHELTRSVDTVRCNKCGNKVTIKTDAHKSTCNSCRRLYTLLHRLPIVITIITKS